MKKSKSLQRFFTLDVHNHEGFTLVELIIVIAILAILSTGAIAGYSAYVERANMTADKALVADIVNVLTLAYYSNELDGEGYIVLYAEKDNTPAFSANSKAEAALQDSYGNFASIRLKYNAWNKKGLISEGAGHVNAEAIMDSTYLTDLGTEKLLGDVQDCASSLSGIFQLINSPSQAIIELREQFKNEDGSEEDNIIDSLLAQAGIKEGDYGSTSYDALSNIAVFAVAAQVQKDKETIIENFADMDHLSDVAEKMHAQNFPMSEVAHWYAAAEALVSKLNDQKCTTSFNKLTAAFGTPPIQDDQGNSFASSGVRKAMQEAYDEIATRIGDAITSSAKPNCSPEDKQLAENYINYYNKALSGGKTQAELDGEAYVGIMGSVSNLTEKYIGDADAMNNPELLTNGGVLADVNTFIAAVTLPEELQNKLTDSSVVIVYDTTKGYLNLAVLPMNIMGQ